MNIPAPEADPAKSRDDLPPHTTGGLYVRRWEGLSGALRRVMAAAGTSPEDAQLAICQAIADGAIRIQAELGMRIPGGTTARGTVLEGPDFQIPRRLQPEKLDWQASRPVNRWMVPRGAFSPHGHWSLAWIEVRTSDVTEVLCRVPQRSEPTRRHAAEPLAKDTEPAPERAIGPTKSREPRRRGRRALKFNATVAAMRQDIAAGGLTRANLDGMVEKNLAERYGVSRDTARKARDAVLSEMTEPNSRQVPTNDK